MASERGTAMRRALVVGVALVFFTGCSQSVVIRSNVPGATVKVDSRTVGKAPARFTDNNGMGKSYSVEVSAPGYVTERRTLSQEWNGACIAASVVGGCMCLLPFLGLTQCASLPQSSYEIRLRKAAGGGSEPAAPSTPNRDDTPSQDEGPIIPL